MNFGEAIQSLTSRILLTVILYGEYMCCREEADSDSMLDGFRKARGTRDQIANIRWVIEKATEFHKNIYFCFIDYGKAFHCVDHNKTWKIL